MNNLENNADLEEIYMERARYLINVDDILEQVLSENISGDNITSAVAQPLKSEELMVQTDIIGADIDIPVIVPFEFSN